MDMASEKEIVMFQKATVYDIRRLLEKEPEKTYTLPELQEILEAYVQGLED